MQKILFFLLFIFIFTACVPIKIAPKIENYKVVKATKFNKKLPKINAFIFKDSKKAGEIHQFIHAKFNAVKELDNYYTFNLNGLPHTITFYEIEKETKTVNLIPVLIDSKLKNKDLSLEKIYSTRLSNNWYIAITVQNKNSSDCLLDSYPNKKEVEKYLENLKNEYLNTSNYMETKMQHN